MRTFLLGLAALLALAGPARADFILTYTDTANGVLASSSGSLDTQSLSRVQTSNEAGFTNGGWAAAGVGNGKADLFSVTITGPATFGTKGYTTATFSTGDFTAMSMNQKLLAVPNGYTSGSTLSGSSLYAGATLASMGLVTGDYVYRYGRDEFFTVRIGSTAVPEPTSVALLGAGLVAAGVVLRRKRV